MQGFSRSYSTLLPTEILSTRLTTPGSPMMINHKRRKQHKSQYQARAENAWQQLTISFEFTSLWLGAPRQNQSKNGFVPNLNRLSQVLGSNYKCNVTKESKSLSTIFSPEHSSIQLSFIRWFYCSLIGLFFVTFTSSFFFLQNVCNRSQIGQLN